MDAFASLTGLRALEAVVRTGSITGAAKALAVTHSAVSHQVHKLENDLGVTLIARKGRGIRPTAAGEKLAADLSTAFGIISDAVRQAVRPAGSDEITISCTGTFLLHWLIPRLYRFKAQRPDIQLKLLEEFQTLDFTNGGYDLAIRIARPPWPEATDVSVLEQEKIGPVMSRDLARVHRIETAGDLSRTALVHTRTRPEAWGNWSALSGNALPKDAEGTWFDHYYFLLEGIRAGLGAGAVPELLARDDLNRGHLTAPLGFVESGNAYIVATRADEARAPVIAFRAWLIEEFSGGAAGAGNENENGVT